MALSSSGELDSFGRLIPDRIRPGCHLSSAQVDWAVDGWPPLDGAGWRFSPGLNQLIFGGRSRLIQVDLEPAGRMITCKLIVFI